MISYSNIFVFFLSFSVACYFFHLQSAGVQFVTQIILTITIFFSLLTGVSMLLNHETNPLVTLFGRCR